jgi:hypothetical protein
MISSNFKFLMQGKLRIALAIAATCIVGVFAWVAVPPLPNPSTLIDHPYSYLVEKLGQPTSGIPTKFIKWSVNKIGFEWFIESDYPLSQDAVPGTVSRELWIQVAGINVCLLQSVAYHKQKIKSEQS